MTNHRTFFGLRDSPVFFVWPTSIEHLLAAEMATNGNHHGNPVVFRSHVAGFKPLAATFGRRCFNDGPQWPKGIIYTIWAIWPKTWWFGSANYNNIITIYYNRIIIYIYKCIYIYTCIYIYIHIHIHSGILNSYTYFNQITKKGGVRVLLMPFSQNPHGDGLRSLVMARVIFQFVRVLLIVGEAQWLHPSGKGMESRHPDLWCWWPMVTCMKDMWWWNFWGDINDLPTFYWAGLCVNGK